MMSPRERLLAPFRGIKPDRPAWLADLGYWYSTALKTGKLPPEFKGEDGYKRLHEYYGICCHYGVFGFVYTERQDGFKIHEKEVQGERICRWSSPRGELTARWKYLTQSWCWACIEYPVKSAADLKVVQDIFLRTHYDYDFGKYLSESERLGESGLPITPLPRSPLPALMADWCGVTNTIYLIADERRAVEDTLSIIDKANDKAFDCILAGPAELLHFGDNLDSGNCASYFNQYMEEYYRRRLGQIHRSGKFAVVHLDGTVRGLLPKLAACGFDGIESVTPAPVGDVEIEELRAVAANPKTIIWGGIPGAMFAKPWTAEDVRIHTLRLLKELWSEGRLVVGSADEIPPDGNINFCRIITDTIEHYF